MATPTWVNFQGPFFTLQVPSNWFVNSTPDIQAMFVEPSRGQNKLRANLIITIQPVEANVTVDAVIASARQTQQREYPQFELRDEGAVEGRGVEGRYQFYTWYNQEAGVQVLQSQTFYIVQELLVTLTTTCEAAEEENIAPVLNALLTSFKFDLEPEA